MKVECLSFLPCHGVEQLQWAREFYHAWCVEHDTAETRSGQTTESVDRWEQWMGRMFISVEYTIQSTVTFVEVKV